MFGQNVRRWLVPGWMPSRRVVIFLVVLALLGLAHPLIFRLLAQPLLAGSSPAECDYFCIHGAEFGRRWFPTLRYGHRLARRACRPDDSLALATDDAARRDRGRASFEQASLSELGKRGVPPADVYSIRADARNFWDEAHALDKWLQGAPGCESVVGVQPLEQRPSAIRAGQSAWPGRVRPRGPEMAA